MTQANTASDLSQLLGGHAFGIRSVHDIFGKLYREKRRFELAGTDNEGRRNQVDAAINFAVTAWHMTDWVWQRQKRELCEHFGVTCKQKFLDKLREQCPGLKVCDVIANAAKHGGTADERDDRPEVQTVLIANPVAEGGSVVRLYATDAGQEWSLRIEVNGKSEDPRALFNRVFKFWFRFIQKYCVSER